MRNEAFFSKLITESTPQSITRIEPGVGMHPGFPDLLVHDDRMPNRFLPVEVKLGRINAGVVTTTKIRPAQLKWHKDWIAAGQRSAFAIGIDDGLVVWFDAETIVGPGKLNVEHALSINNSAEPVLYSLVG